MAGREKQMSRQRDLSDRRGIRKNWQKAGDSKRSKRELGEWRKG